MAKNIQETQEQLLEEHIQKPKERYMLESPQNASEPRVQQFVTRRYSCPPEPSLHSQAVTRCKNMGRISSQLLVKITRRADDLHAAVPLGA